jgi:hypothetical protein
VATTDDSTSASAEASGDSPPTSSRSFSTPVLIAVAIGALVVGGIGGAAVGWKLEQNRVKDDVATIRPIGTVTAVKGDSVSVKLATDGGNRTYVISKDTAIDKAASGASSDLTEGATVLVRSRNTGGKLVATQIIVMPGRTQSG